MTSMIKTQRPSSYLLLVIAVGALIIFAVVGRSLFPGKTLFHFDLLNEAYLPYANEVKYPHFSDHYASDQIQEFYPLYAWHAKQLKDGYFPLWDPYDQGGLPYHENSVRIPLHPFKFLLLVLPVDQVYDLSVCLYFFFAFLAMAYYLSRHGLSRVAVLFGATSWAFCAFFVNNYPREGFIAPIGLIPFVVTLLENLFQKQDIKSTLFFGGGLGFALLISGPVGVFIYLLIILSRFIGFLLWERQYMSFRLLWRIIIGSLISCLIAAPNILGTAHALLTSTRGISGYLNYRLSFNWLLEYFSSVVALGINAFYPFILGSKESLDILKTIGLNIQYSAYFGCLGFLIALVGIKTSLRKPGNKWLVVLAIAGLLTIAPWAIVHLKGRMVILLVFPLIVCAVGGLERILSMSVERLRKAGMIFSFFSLTITIILVVRHFIVRHYYEQLDNKITLFIENRIHGLHFERYIDWKLDAATRFLDLQFITNEHSMFLIVVLFSFSVLIFLGGLLKKRKYIILASMICFVPPIYYAIDNVHVIDKSKYPPPRLTPGLKVMKDNLGHGRVLLKRDDIHGRVLLIKNQLDEFRINHLKGAGSFSPLCPINLNVASLKHPIFDELGITHIVWSKFSPIDSTVIKNVIYDGEIVIGEKIGNPNRCWVVSNLAKEADPKEAIARVKSDYRPMGERIHYVDKLPDDYTPGIGLAGQADIIRENENEVIIVAHLDKPGLLILSDTWYKGWIAEVDGVEKPILRVDGALRGIWLSSGKHNVRFVYKPMIFYVGVVVSLCTILILIGFLFTDYLRHFRRFDNR